MKRSIYLSIEMAKDALSSKEKLEALAFAIQIKYMFVSSTLKGKNTTKKHLKALFKIGDAKLTRCLINAEKYNYIRIQDNIIVANRLYGDKEVCYVIDIPSRNSLILNKQAERLIKEAVLIDQIKKMDYMRDVHEQEEERLTIEDKNKSCTPEHTKRYGLSYDTISKKLNISRIQAINIVKGLRSKGIISKAENFYTLDAKLTKSCFIHAKEFAQTNLRIVEGKVCFQLANVFSLLESKLIRWSSNIPAMNRV